MLPGARKSVGDCGRLKTQIMVIAVLFRVGNRIAIASANGMEEAGTST
jgi:hypothetical protein